MAEHSRRAFSANASRLPSGLRPIFFLRKILGAAAADSVYDEKATHRRIEGRDDIITAWRGWAKAIPDSKATFVREHQTGNIVVLEAVWKGIHSGPLDGQRVLRLDEAARLRCVSPQRCRDLRSGD